MSYSATVLQVVIHGNIISDISSHRYVSITTLLTPMSSILSIHNIFPQRVHDDMIKWKHFSRCWPFVRGIHRWPVNSPHKGQWRGAVMFSFICAWINGWENNRKAGDLRRHHDHYDVLVMRRQLWYFQNLFRCQWVFPNQLSFSQWLIRFLENV